MKGNKLLNILSVFLMAGAAVFFPAALYFGMSYDAVTAVFLVVLAAVLLVLHMMRGSPSPEPSDQKGDQK